MICRALIISLLLSVVAPALAAPSQRAVARLVREDQCQAVEGYSAFRQALRRAAGTRDVRVLQQLFHPRGSMRVHGVYMSATAADADPAGFAPVFAEIDDILGRGCARNGERLILPGIARLAEENVATEALVVIRPTWLHRRPTTATRAIRLGTGRVVTELIHGDRWTRVQAGTADGFVPTADVRNPYDTRIELQQHNGRWTIIEFGSGI